LGSGWRLGVELLLGASDYHDVGALRYESVRGGSTDATVIRRSAMELHAPNAKRAEAD